MFNPFINYQIRNLNNYIGTNVHIKRDVQLIVNLTSYPERFYDLPKILYSLINQTLKPDRIILWLGDENAPLSSLPYEITQFIKNGLEIRFVKDIGTYTKSIYAFKEFNDSIIVTADDDIYYEKNWLRLLYLSYIANPNDIHVHKAREISFNSGKIIGYQNKNSFVNKENADYNNFIISSGGVLYPPNCFSNEVLRDDIFLKIGAKSDDVWFWTMSVINNHKIRVVKNHYKSLVYTNIFDKILKIQNIDNRDEQFEQVLKYYGQNILSKLR